jgi:hypothetical protein
MQPDLDTVRAIYFRSFSVPLRTSKTMDRPRVAALHHQQMSGETTHLNDELSG